MYVLMCECALLSGSWPSQASYFSLMTTLPPSFAITPPLSTGVNHNIPVLRDIITQPKFISGDINTNFIKEVYPKGFKGQWVGPHNWFCTLNLMSVVPAGHELSREERNELIGAACFMHVRREELARQFLNQER